MENTATQKWKHLLCAPAEEGAARLQIIRSPANLLDHTWLSECLQTREARKAKRQLKTQKNQMMQSIWSPTWQPLRHAWTRSSHVALICHVLLRTPLHLPCFTIAHLTTYHLPQAIAQFPKLLLQDRYSCSRIFSLLI